MAKFRDDDDDDAFGPDGLLKDGRKTRISLMMRDADTLSSVQRVIAEDAVARRFGLRDSSELYAPGPRYCTDRAGFERKAEAYRQMCAELQDAWKMLPAPTEAADGRETGWEEEDSIAVSGPPRAMDADEARRIKAAAYQQMVDEMTSAWKGPAR